ncbi:hypothetical protein K2173_009652 [Erythroxylum novogranatense]|uniref:Dof zinc finger protein n=1 Tax=Erythroxylum novogranatense TaxID=1862640 RepID=A0AAV8U4J0_9ROSI|nr:hypothetical protein K2173_009652 [Erythroxylum novogranatense]
MFQPMKPQFPEQEQLKCPRCDSTNTKFCYYNNYNLSQPRHFCKACRRYWTKGGTLRNIPVGGGSRKNNKRSTNQKRTNPDPDPEPGRVSRRVQEPLSPSSTAAATGESQQLLGNANSDPGLGQGQVEGPPLIYGLEGDHDRKVMDVGGSFSSLLTSSGQFGSIFDGLNPNGSGLKMVPLGGFVEDLNMGLNSDSALRPGRDNTNNNSRSSSGGGGGGGGGEGSGGDASYLQGSEWGNSNGWPDIAIYTPGTSFH